MGTRAWSPAGGKLTRLFVLCALFALSATSSALASETTTYSATETVPVPPASSFAGSGGGDGWAVALSSDAVYNVFHHSGTLTFACHKQSDASDCYSPETITDAASHNFGTSGQPGMYLDQNTGKLYVYATRDDNTAGVVCIDTTLASTNTNPFCGFTALTQTGEASYTSIGMSNLSDPMLIGTRWYAFNYVSGAGVSGAENTLLCFDVSTDAACAGQPIAISIGSGSVSVGYFPSPATAVIGSKAIIPIVTSGGEQLACFDDSTQESCGGSWPVSLGGISYVSNYGAPFPLLNATGTLTGLCLPTGIDQCFTLSGESTSTPKELPAVVSGSDGWNGPAFVLGPRIYLANGNFNNRIECFDYSTGAGCANFPRELENLGFIYTVNPDPQRPTCIWANGDNGSGQIQNLDAYTGGACGEGTIRVLASQFVVPQPKCTPASYVSLQVLSPDPSTYTSGSIGFDDGDGNPIAGLESRPLDKTGTADLSGLELNTPTGLPQFLITLVGESGKVGSVEIKLTWKANYDPSCAGEESEVEAQPTEVATSLSGGGKSGALITVAEGTAVTDTATLSGTDAAGASGKVSYAVYSDAACTNAVASAGEVTVSGGIVPVSTPQTLAPGTYYWQASYGGDEGNTAAKSVCGSEIETVEGKSEEEPQCTQMIGEALFRIGSEKVTVKNHLSTNLASSQEFLFTWQSGKQKLRLMKLTKAACRVTAKRTTFSGTGAAKLGGKQGYVVKFTISVFTTGKLRVTVGVYQGKTQIEKFIGVALTGELPT